MPLQPAGQLHAQKLLQSKHLRRTSNRGGLVLTEPAREAIHQEIQQKNQN